MIYINMYIIHCKTYQIVTTYTWDDIINYVNDNKIKLMIVDIDGVILSENSDILTEKNLDTKLKTLQDQGITIICLTARPNSVKYNNYVFNNGYGTSRNLYSKNIFPNEIRFTNRNLKGKFIHNILKEYDKIKDHAIFIDNDIHQINNASYLNNIKIFQYLGDLNNTDNIATHAK